MRSFQKDMEDSHRRFTEIIWPFISEYIGGGRLISVENINDEMAKLLDMKYGVDYIQDIDGVGARIISSRVQCGSMWPTFTIRKQRDSGAITEYEKLLNSCKLDGSLMPYFTVQSYLSDDEKIWGVGIAKTKDIIREIYKGNCTVNRCGNASFYVVQFDILDMIFRHGSSVVPPAEQLNIHF